MNTRSAVIGCALALSVVLGACGGGGSGSGGAATPVNDMPTPAPAPSPAGSFKSIVVSQFALDDTEATRSTPIAIDEMTIEYQDLDDPLAFEELTRDDG